MAGIRVLAAQPRPVQVTPRAVAASCHRWEVFGSSAHPARPWLLRSAPAETISATATAVLLGAEFTPDDNARLLAGIRASQRHRGRLVLLHQGAGGSSLVRAATAEDPELRSLCLELPEVPTPGSLHTAMAMADSGLASADEMCIDAEGRITSTGWSPVSWPPAPRTLSHRGSVVVTGGLGGLGIRAAALFAHLYGLHPVLIDCREPDDLDPPAGKYLRRLASCPTGVTVRTANVTVPAQVAMALSSLPAPVSVLLHCAGVLHGAAVAECRVEDLVAAQEVKVAGLRHVLHSTDTRHLRSLIVFGSVLAECSPHNLGCYALANELMRRATSRMGASLPDTSTVVAQWSVWAGAGMAHELGVVPQARRMGLTPIALRPGMLALCRLLAMAPGSRHAARLLLLGSGTGSVHDEHGTPAARHRTRRQPSQGDGPQRGTDRRSGGAARSAVPTSSRSVQDDGGDW
jgi:NAD(P)-dependent dehydrogenase (short-subunit alcohol dehydrogenase family)